MAHSDSDSDSGTDTATADVPGIRPDLATVYCRNCGYEFEPRGNPLNTPPNASVPADCDECPSGGTVLFNRFSYIRGTYGAVGVRKKDE